MTQKNRTLEGKNRTLGGEGGQKSSKIVGHHLCTFPYSSELNFFTPYKKEIHEDFLSYFFGFSPYHPHLGSNFGPSKLSLHGYFVLWNCRECSVHILRSPFLKHVLDKANFWMICFSSKSGNLLSINAVNFFVTSKILKSPSLASLWNSLKMASHFVTVAWKSFDAYDIPLLVIPVQALNQHDFYVTQ